MKKKMKFFYPVFMCFTLLFPIFTSNAQAATTITSNQTGTHDGYNYELWKDSGNTSMTLNSGGTFSCQWSNINNALFRKGKKFNETQTHKQLGNISVNYNCNYQPSGNSYMCIYGWTSSPLVEYYIVDSWGTWRPPGASSKGTITVDGGTYDIYETTRTNQPSIKGNTTFKQYWSVRTSKRTSGTISVSEHFKAWENKGMTLGKMYEVAFTIEGYQSSGKADVTAMSMNIGGSTGNAGTNTGSISNTNSINNTNNKNNTTSNTSQSSPTYNTGTITNIGNTNTGKNNTGNNNIGNNNTGFNNTGSNWWNNWNNTNTKPGTNTTANNKKNNGGGWWGNWWNSWNWNWFAKPSNNSKIKTTPTPAPSVTSTASRPNTTPTPTVSGSTSVVPTTSVPTANTTASTATIVKDISNRSLPNNYSSYTSSNKYGTLKSFTYYSNITKTNRPANIILPNNYSTSKKYPVLYMLHGIGGNQNAWGSGNSCSLLNMAGNLVSAGKAEDMIIVMPYIRVSTTAETNIFSNENFKYYDLFADELVNNLMPYMEKNYSIKTGRENTAVAGFSMGGRESLYIGVSRPDLFGYTGAFCPAPGIFENTNMNVHEKGFFSSESAFTIPDKYKSNTVIMIVKGTTDTVVGNFPATYNTALTNNKVPHYYYEVEGGHEEKVWGHGYYNFLQRIFGKTVE